MNQTHQEYACPYCRQAVEKDARFCGHCGQSLENVSLVPMAAPKRRSFLPAISIVLVLLLLAGGFYYVTAKQNDGNSAGQAASSEQAPAESEADKEMKALMAKEVLEPDNNNKADFVVGRWLINNENLRIRKIGATEYRADDEANKKAYAIAWDGTHYTLTRGKDTLVFRVKDFDNLILQDGNACGYRIKDNGERIIRIAPTDLYKDILHLPFGELKKKYRLTNIPYEENNAYLEKYMPTFNIGFSGPLVIHCYMIKDTDIFLIYRYPAERTSDGNYDFESAYAHMPDDIYPQVFSGKCKDFLTNVPEGMSQREYVTKLYENNPIEYDKDFKSFAIWRLDYELNEENQKKYQYYPAVSFVAPEKLNEIKGSDPIGPDHFVGFYGFFGA